MLRGREAEAEKIVGDIERAVEERSGEKLPEPEGRETAVRGMRSHPAEGRMEGDGA